MRSSRTSDARWINLFLDMLAAEQGAGHNTLDAYRRDLTDFSQFIARAGRGLAGVETQALRDYLEDLDARGFKSSSVARRLSAMRPLVSFPAERAGSQRRSGRDPFGTEARPRPAEGAVDRRRRSPAGARQGAGRCTGSLRAAAASRKAVVLPARGALRHRPQGDGTGDAAALGVATRRPHDRGARQGQQGTAGTAERGVATGDGRLPRRDRSAQAREEEERRRLEMAVSLVRRERTFDAAAFRARPEGAVGFGRTGAAAGKPACGAPCGRNPF